MASTRDARVLVISFGTLLGGPPPPSTAYPHPGKSEFGNCDILHAALLCLEDFASPAVFFVFPFPLPPIFSNSQTFLATVKKSIAHSAGPSFSVSLGYKDYRRTPQLSLVPFGPRYFPNYSSSMGCIPCYREPLYSFFCFPSLSPPWFFTICFFFFHIPGKGEQSVYPGFPGARLPSIRLGSFMVHHFSLAILF